LPLHGVSRRRRNYESVRALAAAKVKVEDTKASISAKRLLPAARAAGYGGSDRNFRRLVAQEKSTYRQREAIGRGRRPAVWSPGEHLVIDWGVLDGLHVFCAVLAFCRVRFVRFADNERADTTMRLLAECFEVIGGVPKVVLTDRMGCVKGGVVADVVIPTPDYVRFAAHYRFRPDFCQARDPQSKGIVENLVGYAKRDLMVGLGAGPGAAHDLAAANTAAELWCEQVNNAEHSQIAAVPAQRLADVELALLGGLPSLAPAGLLGGRRELRKVDKLSCVRFGSARYSVPNRMLGAHVEVLAGAGGVTILVPATGEVLAEHPLMAPGQSSVLDAHHGRPRPSTPARKVRPDRPPSRRSAPWVRSRSSGWPAPPPRATPALAPNWPNWQPCRRRTAATPSSRPWHGRSPSAGGKPAGSAPSWLPAPVLRSRPTQATRWSSSCPRPQHAR